MPESRPDVAPEDLPKVGDILVDKYEVLGVLGAGGMGAVLEAKHVSLGHRVALKVLLPKAREDSEVAKRFQREARAAARLSGPHVTRILDVEELPDGRPFIVMEKLTGRDLADELLERGRMPYREIADILIEACSGIAEAHACGIIHRDLKPSNLFLSEAADGTRTVKLMDFGISKVTDDTGQALTQTHSTFGTPLYMSPEQVRSSKEVDARADVWSMGVILYELVTGKLPFEGANSVATIAAILETKPARPREINQDVPEDIERVIMKALAKDPDDRYATIKDLARALRPYGSKKKAGVSTAPPPPPVSVRGNDSDPAESGKLSLAQTVRAPSTGQAPKPQPKPLVVISAALLTAVAGSAIVYAVFVKDSTVPAAPATTATAEAAKESASAAPATPEVTPSETADGASPGTSSADALATAAPTSVASGAAGTPTPTGPATPPPPKDPPPPSKAPPPPPKAPPPPPKAPPPPPTSETPTYL